MVRVGRLTTSLSELGIERENRLSIYWLVQDLWWAARLENPDCPLGDDIKMSKHAASWAPRTAVSSLQ